MCAFYFAKRVMTGHETFRNADSASPVFFLLDHLCKYRQANDPALCLYSVFTQKCLIFIKYRTLAQQAKIWNAKLKTMRIRIKNTKVIKKIV